VAAEGIEYSMVTLSVGYLVAALGYDCIIDVNSTVRGRPLLHIITSMAFYRMCCGIWPGAERIPDLVSVEHV
jgi:hypothetical protein